MGPGKILLARSHCPGLVKRMGSDGWKFSFDGNAIAKLDLALASIWRKTFASEGA